MAIILCEPERKCVLQKKSQLPQRYNISCDSYMKLRHLDSRQREIIDGKCNVFKELNPSHLVLVSFHTLQYCSDHNCEDDKVLFRYKKDHVMLKKTYIMLYNDNMTIESLFVSIFSFIFYFYNLDWIM